MAEDSVSLELVLEQLRDLKGEVYELRKEVCDIKREAFLVDGERRALARLGAILMALCTAVGALFTVVMNWPKVHD